MMMKPSWDFKLVSQPLVFLLVYLGFTITAKTNAKLYSFCTYFFIFLLCYIKTVIQCSCTKYNLKYAIQITKYATSYTAH